MPLELIDSKRERAIRIIHLLRSAVKPLVKPLIHTLEDEFGHDPFIVLISCLLSLRAKDTATYPVCQQLFKKARTPAQLLALSSKELETLFYTIGFYRTKARLVHAVSKEIIERFGGKVPATKAELLSIKGVGPKTANLVLSEGFGIPAICVDTHVHRISNRLGLVSTKTPEQTERELMELLPQEYWREINYLLVIWGQNICVPLSPRCSVCAIEPECPQIGVLRKR